MSLARVSLHSQHKKKWRVAGDISTLCRVQISPGPLIPEYKEKEPVLEQVINDFTVWRESEAKTSALTDHKIKGGLKKDE